MKKILSLCLALLFLPLIANAQHKIVISLANGDVKEYQVWEINDITFAEGDHISTPTKANAVDLDLPSGLKWADMNFGATSSTAAGNSIGWGDITGKNTSSLLNYFPVLKPTSDIISGSYDIVHVMWEGDWRLPSADDIQELIDNCNWAYDATRNGYVVSSKKSSSKSIFLPITNNEGTSYWTGSLNTTNTDNALTLSIDDVSYEPSQARRNSLLQIRPVYGKYIFGATVESAYATNVGKTDAYVVVEFAGNVGDASEKGVSYSETSNVDPDQNPKVISGEDNGDGTYTYHITGLTPNTTYYYVPYIVYAGNKNLGSIKSFTTKAKFPVAEAVDLGLSVKFAKWNIGSESEIETGKLIAWGDPTAESRSFVNTDYPNELQDISGTKYDPATKQWGAGWRMPKPEEMKELDKLKKELVTLSNGVKAWKVTASNGNYIYLPRGGYETRSGVQDANQNAAYWTSKNNTQDYAHGISIGKATSNEESYDQKGWHMLIRPVYGSYVDPSKPVDNGIELTAAGKAATAVDLGLSVKWASYNLGTTSSSSTGSYFSWGSTEAGTEFTRNNYQWYNTTTSQYEIPVTNISNTAYDAARELWGGTWHMPTSSEMEELVSQCTWTRQSDGYKVVGPNGNSIFLPFTGIISGTRKDYDQVCYYWSGSYNTLPLHATDYWAWYLTTPTTAVPTVIATYAYKGMCIRPVRP